MKNLLFAITLIIPFSSIAQTNSGVIIYEEVKNTKPDMAKAEEQGWAHRAAMIPASMTFKKRLVFTEESSMYVTVKKKEDPTVDERQRRMERRFSNANNQTYINSKENEFVEQQDFMGKIFLIKGKPKKIKWKMTGEMKEIAGHPCLKATYSDSTDVIEAWFATNIPVPIGPEKYGDLPGIILELSSKKDKKIIVAKTITFREVDPTEVLKPVKGKEVTREQYRKIVREKRKEMRANGGGFGGPRGGGRGPR